MMVIWKYIHESKRKLDTRHNLWPNKSSPEHLYFQVEKLYWLCFQSVLTFSFNCLVKLSECPFNLSHYYWNQKLSFIIRKLFLSLFKDTAIKSLSRVTRSSFDFPANPHVAISVLEAQLVAPRWCCASGGGGGGGEGQGQPWGLFWNRLWDQQKCSGDGNMPLLR